jgi:hypothetical protein
VKAEAAAGREQIFLQIGVQQRLFTKEQADDARRNVPAAPTLGEALITRGVLTRDQQRGLERAVTYRLGRDEDKRIAQIIVDSGYCPEARVQEALKRQKDSCAWARCSWTTARSPTRSRSRPTRSSRSSAST